MVKVLHELASLDGGGVARLLYDYYSNMDRSEVQFDFLIYDYFKEGILEQPVKNLGCNVFKITKMETDRHKSLSEMKNVIKNGNYDIVHSHRGPQGYYFLSMARRCGIKHRLIHSHLNYKSASITRRTKNDILLFFDKILATNLLACGKEAGISMWGKKNMNRGNIHIMTNAINIDKFRFSEEERIQKRRELNISDKLVIGIVGRLEEQKNYPFLVEVFDEVLKRNNNSALLIIGRGNEEKNIREAVNKKGLSDYVHFLGVRDDVHKLLNVMDVFVLPSFYEGLPVVLVEAQANGLPEIVSDKVTSEMEVTDLIQFLPINNASIWADAILNVDIKNRNLYADIVDSKGYGIAKQAQLMQNYYIGLQGD